MRVPEYNSVYDYVKDIRDEIRKESKDPNSLDHIGYYILKGMRNFPDRLNQIDGATGQRESNAEILARAIDCATALMNFGIAETDVVVTMAPNHIDIAVPFYASTLIATPFAGVDRNLTYVELKHMLNIIKPKIIFCQAIHVKTIEEVQKDMSFTIITFDSSEETAHLQTFKSFIEKYKSKEPQENFKVRELPSADHPAYLISTSGSTGLPKCATMPHVGMLKCTMLRSEMLHSGFPPDLLVFQQSPAQWVTFTLFTLASACFGLSRMQTSGPPTLDHVYELINKYRPQLTVASPAMAFALMTQPDKVDLTCFQLLYTTGSHSSNELQAKLCKLITRDAVIHMYGSTEVCGCPFMKDPSIRQVECVGKPDKELQCKIIDTETGKECETGQVGELWMKGPVVFKGYYNMPEETANAFSEDGWFKTGDLLCKKEDGMYYYVDRIKLCFKYNSIQVSPAQVEGVLSKLPGVAQVAVSGIPQDVFSSLPAALIVKTPRSDLTEERIHAFMKESMSDAKQLRGGVVFCDRLPVTSIGKIDRNKVKSLLLEAYDKRKSN